jgi:D-glycero-D-manno-heptose 1,7-bisphosphate phosphatase
LLTIVATNQSGIARGILTENEYQAGERRVDELLAKKGARLDAHYFCPHLPDVTGPCECRKPGTLLFRQAALRFGIDMGRSWWVGDRLRDVLAADAFGGTGILLGENEPEGEESRRFLRARDLAGAVDLILQ